MNMNTLLRGFLIGLVGGIMLTSHASAQTDVQFLVDGNNAFAWDLYAALQAEDGNLFFSPYSISTALAMTYAGARGKTAQEMAAVLHFPENQEKLHPAFAALAHHVEQLNIAWKGSPGKGTTGSLDGPLVLCIANALWPDKALMLLEPFVTTNKTYYGANLFQVDFVGALEASRQQINQWVFEKTAEKIAELLHKDDVTRDTVLVLTNAIYFKGSWLVPFDETETSDGPFWLSPETSVQVPMMHRLGNFYATEAQDASVLFLPYQGETVWMGVVLPHEKDGLAQVEQSLNVQQINAWLEAAQETKLLVSVPKFKTTFRIDLADTLMEMGMGSAFKPGADFSGMTPASVFITKVIHKAFIEIHEKGTEVAAATAVIMGRSMPRQFQVDHPFVFFIVDTSSQSLLFVGRIMDPTK